MQQACLGDAIARWDGLQKGRGNNLSAAFFENVRVMVRA